MFSLLECMKVFHLISVPYQGKLKTIFPKETYFFYAQLFIFDNDVLNPHAYQSIAISGSPRPR